MLAAWRQVWGIKLATFGILYRSRTATIKVTRTHARIVERLSITHLRVLVYCKGVWLSRSAIQIQLT